MSISLDPTRTVNDVIAAYPNALPTLSARGIDTCCGGHEPLEAAAQAVGVDLTALIHDITAGEPPSAVRDAAPSCACGCSSKGAR